MTRVLRPGAAAVRRRVRLATARATSRVLGPAEGRAAATWRAELTGGATDVTEEATGDPRPLLVVAPHPDDETIGCGVLMARRRDAGLPVTVVVVSDGGTSHHSEQITPEELGRLRREESRSACASLGVDDVRFLGYGERALRQEADRLRADLAALVTELAPGQVAVPYRRDWHPEHVIVHDAAVRACASAGFAGTLREYPVWSWSDGPAAIPPMAGPWRRLAALRRNRRLRAAIPAAARISTAGYGERKRAAFALYRTQVTRYTGEPGWQPFPPAWIDPFVTDGEVYLPHDASSEA